MRHFSSRCCDTTSIGSRQRIWSISATTLPLPLPPSVGYQWCGYIYRVSDMISAPFFLLLVGFLDVIALQGSLTSLRCGAPRVRLRLVATVSSEYSVVNRQFVQGQLLQLYCGYCVVVARSEEVGRGGQLWCLPPGNAAADGPAARCLRHRLGSLPREVTLPGLIEHTRTLYVLCVIVML